jgi:diguanylate cyclase (GGDEF)-like protein
MPVAFIDNLRELFSAVWNRYIHRAADWLVDSPVKQSYIIQRQLRCHSLMKKRTLVVGVVITTFMAFIVAIISGHGWAYAWLAAEIILGSVRLNLLASFEKAEARGNVGNTTAPAIASLAWTVVISTAYYFCVASGEWILILLAGTGLAGILGGISSRNAGTPRYGVVMMCMLALPYSLAAILSPIPYLYVVGLQTPLWLVGMISILRENYKILLDLYRTEQENLRLAHHDILTGLPNRIMKQKRLNELLGGPLPSTKEREHFTVFCLDLDGFKEVNDRFGHAAGDALLVAVARRLRDSVREQDFVCRVGGDEFVALLPSLSDDEAASIAGRVIDKISKPYEIGLSAQPRVGVSIGSACAPRDGADADELLRSADHALYEAKRRGKGIYVAQPASISEVVELAPVADADSRLVLKFPRRKEAGVTAHLE